MQVKFKLQPSGVAGDKGRVHCCGTAVRVITALETCCQNSFLLRSSWLMANDQSRCIAVTIRFVSLNIYWPPLAIRRALGILGYLPINITTTHSAAMANLILNLLCPWLFPSLRDIPHSRTVRIHDMVDDQDATLGKRYYRSFFIILFLHYSPLSLFLTLHCFNACKALFVSLKLRTPLATIPADLYQ
jgi:hypothetical protein